MRSIAARVACCLAVLAFAGGRASAQAAAEPFATNDYGGTGDVLNVLPPGQKGVFNAAEEAQMAAVCTPTTDPQACSRDPGDYPPNTIEQLLMYDGLIQAAPTLTPDELRDYFKDATFGVPPHEIARQYSPGGRAGVVVIRDAAHGVPRIFADNRSDAVFAAGYVSAEDRLFLMDVLRHVGRGRMSEFLGPSPGNLAMDRDIYRSAGYDEAELQSMVDHLDEEDPVFGPITQQGFEDFADGVNQYLTDALLNPALLPAEYFTLQQAPTPWSVTDTVAVASLIGATFGVGGGGELGNCRFLAELEARYGDPAVARQVFEDFNQDDDPEKPSTTSDPFPYLVQGPVDPAAVACPDPETLDVAVRGATPIAGNGVDGPHGPIPLRLDSRASNALLVGAERSETGFPLAVFGPQTGYFMPQILMELEVHAPADGTGPTIDARGAAFPGISLLVLLGRGRDFAWSATSAGSDLVDVVAARLCEPGGIVPPSFESRHYRYDGQCLPMYVRQDVWVAKPGPGGLPSGPPPLPEPSQLPPPLPDLEDDPLFSVAETVPGLGEYLVTAEVLRTVHGIVQSFGTVNGEPVAYVRQRSTFFHEVDSATPFIKLNSPDLVQDAGDFQQAMAGLNFTFNWFYVDRDDIAYEVSGHYPIRPSDAQGRSVDFDLPYLADGAWDWQGWSNPGFPLSTPNHLSWKSDRLPFARIPKDLNPAQGYLTSWNNAQAPQWNAADANLSYGPLHRSLPLDDRVLADASMTLTELVQAMEDAGTVDLRGDKLVPLLAQLLPAPTGNAALGLSLLNAWHAAGAQRRDLDGDGAYDHAAAVALMDRWWVALGDAVFDTLGPSARGAMPLGRHDAPGPVGSAFISGWYGIVHKDLRGALGGAPVAPFSRVYCGDGVLADCRAAVSASLDAAVQSLIDEFGPDPAGWQADDDGDRVQFAIAGTAQVPDMHWVNRPTFQQVVEFRLDAQDPDAAGDGVPAASDNCPWVANPGQENADADAWGDACECGDVDGDGDVDAADADLLRDHLNEEAPLPDGSLCDTNHDVACTNVDVSRIEATAGSPQQLLKEHLVCRATVGPERVAVVELPEPGAAAGLAAGGLALAALARRRRARKPLRRRN